MAIRSGKKGRNTETTCALCGARVFICGVWVLLQTAYRKEEKRQPETTGEIEIDRIAGAGYHYRQNNR